MPTAIVYLRHGCHLCEAFLEELADLASAWDLQVQTIDIDTDDADMVLRTRYDHRVPVLNINGEDICEYFVDAERLTAYFESR